MGHALQYCHLKDKTFHVHAVQVTSWAINLPVKVQCYNERFYFTEVPVIVISKLKSVKPVVFEATSILKVAEIASFGFSMVFHGSKLERLGH